MLGYGVKETTATTGTGTLTLSSVANFPRFSDAFPVDNDLCLYSLLDASGQPLECGIGTSVGSAHTLARTLPLVTYSGGTYNDNSPSAVSLSGTTTVICTGVPQSGYPFVAGIGSAAGNKNYGGQNFAMAGTVTQVLVALTIYVVPHQINAVRPITGLRFRVSTAAAAGKVGVIGLYRVKTDGSLSDLLQTSGSIAVDTTGVKTYTFGTPKTYPTGWYAIALISDGTPTINASGGATSAPVPGFMGGDTNNSGVDYYTTTAASASLPNPFTGTITNVVGSSTPSLYLVTA